jgi:hypothetical protein
MENAIFSSSIVRGLLAAITIAKSFLARSAFVLLLSIPSQASSTEFGRVFKI